MDGRTEWASEGEPKQVGEPEKALRDQSQRMVVRIKWAHCAKPGGTAGDFLLLSQHNAWDRSVLFVPQSKGA